MSFLPYVKLSPVGSRRKLSTIPASLFMGIESAATLCGQDFALSKLSQSKAQWLKLCYFFYTYGWVIIEINFELYIWVDSLMKGLNIKCYPTSVLHRQATSVLLKATCVLLKKWEL